MAGICLRIGLATIAGFIIGLERELKGKSAGLRTNCLGFNVFEKKA
ncbi:MgtC/SapB family protein [Autumnicola musiva]|uniref:MgtC/SapB family protein n=1 Tax=Autumnicola musiva TaxID=3075589 RepID=A0ABU3D8A7_9FLAO|nr:MgtC/SapB family protein [Zunongwangia sp. F117]MDT0677760.1 MgtC/SapB family protein [Zunongwangia sp. F117]